MSAVGSDRSKLLPAGHCCPNRKYRKGAGGGGFKGGEDLGGKALLTERCDPACRAASSVPSVREIAECLLHPRAGGPQALHSERSLHTECVGTLFDDPLCGLETQTAAYCFIN